MTLVNLKVELNRADIVTNVKFQDSSHDNSIREDEAKLVIKVEDAKIWNLVGEKRINLNLNEQEVKNYNDGSIFKIGELKNINLILPKELAESFYRAIYIREKLCDKITEHGVAENSKWKFTIKGINYRDKGLDIHKVQNLLTLTAGVDFRVSNENIIDFDVIGDFSPDSNTDHLQEFEIKKMFYQLEKLFAKEKRLFSREPFMLLDLDSSEFAKLLKFQSCGMLLPTSPNKLETQLNWIYNLELPKIGGEVTEKFYKITLDKVIRNQREFNLWKECGFDNLDDILKANANGFTIVNRGGFAEHATIGSLKKTDGSPDHTATGGFGNLDNLDNIKSIKKFIQNKKYRGFPMIGSDQSISVPASLSFDGNISFFGKKFIPSITPPFNKINKNKIDGFRFRLSKAGIVSDENTVPNMDGDGIENHDSVMDSKLALGFLPEYLNESGGHFGGHVSGGLDSLMTRICFDIIEANNRKEAIDVAFFGEDYEHPKKKYVIKHDFDEVSKYFKLTTDDNGALGNRVTNVEWKNVESKREVLQLYYEVMKNNVRNMVNNEWGGDDLYDSTTSNVGKVEIDAAFKVVEKWVEIWDKKGEYSTFPRSRINELRNDKATLDNFITDANDAVSHPWEAKLVNRWKTEINLVISEIQTKLINFDTPPPPPNQQRINWEQKLRDAKDANYYGNTTLDNEEKKIFEHFDIKGAINNNALYDAAVKLINLLKKSFEAKVENIDEVNKNYRETLTKLENYTNSIANAEEKNIWKIANESVKKGGIDWGKVAIKHLKAVIAKKTAKDKTYGQEKLSQDEFDEVFDSLKEEITIKATTILLEKVKEALKKTEAADSLLDELMEYRDSTGRSEKRWAWEAVNKFNHENKPQGQEAIRKLESFKSKIKIFQDKLTKCDNLGDLRQEFEEIKNDPEFIENQTFLENWKKHQQAKLEIMSETDINDDDREEIVKTLAIKYKDNNNYNKDNQSELEQVIDLYKKFTGTVVAGTPEEIFYQKYKEVIDEKLSEVQASLSKIKNEESQKPKDDSTILQTILVCSIIAIFLGIFTYFFKRREGKEE